jgi:hypothetical protein
MFTLSLTVIIVVLRLQETLIPKLERPSLNEEKAVVEWVEKWDVLGFSSKHK